MADIRPFRALRYDLPKAGDIQELTCPPYDIISPDQRREYLSRNRIYQTVSSVIREIPLSLGHS